MDSDDGIPIGKEKKKFTLHRVMRRRFPIVQWLPTYSRTDAIADAVAGVTLGLTLVPQSIAYAALADLPVQYGLYSSFMGTILYVFLGSVKEVSIGPTSLMALMTLQTCRGLPIEYVVLLTFLSGCVVLLMGLLKLGFLVELISGSVTSGFTSATAVIIVASQLKGLLGLTFTAETVYENVKLIAEHINNVRLGDCVLSIVCLCTLLSLRKLKDVKLGGKRAQFQKWIWLLSISRNAIVVCCASLFAYLTYRSDRLLVKLSGLVEPGLPPFGLPPFSVTVANETVGFAAMVHQLGSAVVMTPVVMMLANIAIAKAFTGGRMDATQEMLTLGLCNMLGACVRSMPTCGAFTRSAVSHSSGVSTPAAGLYSGVITLLALTFMTPYFYFIPKACLSSVLICAVIFMIDTDSVVRLWRRDKSELVVLMLTFLVGIVWNVELAVPVGAALSLARLLRNVMWPHVAMYTVKGPGGECVVIRPSVCVVYANVSRLCAYATRALRTHAHATLLVDCSLLTYIDYSAQQELDGLGKKCKENDQNFVIFNVTKEALRYLESLPNLDKRSFTARSAAEALRALALDASLKNELTSLLSTQDGVNYDDKV